MSKKKRFREEADAINGKPCLHAVVEVLCYEGGDRSPPWPIALSNPPWLIRLSGKVTDREVGSVFAQLVNYNHLESNGDVKELLDQVIMTSSLILPGGLQVSSDADKVINPSCCCGLEQWRDWLIFLKTGQSPWLGHDPKPWVEKVGNLVRVWSDEGARAFHIDFEYSKFESQLSKVQQDLNAFLAHIESWAARVGFPEPSKLSSKFDECFAVSRWHRK